MPDSGPSSSSSSSSSASSSAKPKSKLATFMDSKYNSKDASGNDPTAQFFKDLAQTMGIEPNDFQAANYIDPVDRYAFEDPYANVMKKIDYKPSYISPDFEPTFRGNLKQVDSPIYFEQPTEGGPQGQAPVAKAPPPEPEKPKTPSIADVNGKTDKYGKSMFLQFVESGGKIMNREMDNAWNSSPELRRLVEEYRGESGKIKQGLKDIIRYQGLVAQNKGYSNAFNDLLTRHSDGNRTNRDIYNKYGIYT